MGSGLGPVQSPGAAEPGGGNDETARAQQKIKELEEAHAAGTLSDEEFEDQKARLMQEERRAD